MNAELPSEKSMINDDIVEVVDSGISENDKTLEFDETLNNAIIRPNLDSIRRILGADGTEQARKVVEENTGLIPKFYKVRSGFRIFQKLKQILALQTARTNRIWQDRFPLQMQLLRARYYSSLFFPFA